MTKGHFGSVAKVSLRFGCTKQSKNLEKYLIYTRIVVVLLVGDCIALARAAEHIVAN